MPESKSPHSFKEAVNYTDLIAAYNPMCGDKFSLKITLSNSHITDCSFQGFGCAVSKASTSILLKSIEGLSLKESINLCENFIQEIDGNLTGLTFDEPLVVLSLLKDFDGRIDCIKLSWVHLLSHLIKRSNEN
jgi:nitrogen fixation NifU-like protein